MTRLLNTVSKIIIWLVLIIYNLDSLQYYLGFQLLNLSSDLVIAGVILLIVVSLLLLAIALIGGSPTQLESARYNHWYGIDMALLPVALFFFLISGAITSMIMIGGVLLLVQLGIVLRYPVVREEEKKLRGGLAELTGSLLAVYVYTFVSNIASLDPLLNRGIWMIVVGVLSYGIFKSITAFTAYQDHIISTVDDDTSTEDLLYAKA